MRVFLSSTYADLVGHRQAAATALERLNQQVGRMEVFGARPDEPAKACVDEIDQCGIFVGIYAHRYGFVPQGSDSRRPGDWNRCSIQGNGDALCRSDAIAVDASLGRGAVS